MEGERGQLQQLQHGLWAFSGKENYDLGSNCKFIWLMNCLALLLIFLFFIFVFLLFFFWGGGGGLNTLSTLAI